MKPKPVSEELRALALKGFECWNGGEIDAMADMYAPDGEFDMTAFVDGGIRRGRDEMTAFWREMWDAWQGVRMDPLDIFEIDSHRYLIPTRMWGRGLHSGAEVDQEFTFLYTLGEDGLIVRSKAFPDTEAALSAAESEV